MKKAFLVILAAVLLLAGWRYHRRLFQDDRDRISAIIMEMKAGAEARQADRILSWFADDYTDEGGNSKFVLYRIVGDALAAVDEMKVEVKDVSIVAGEDRATADLTVITEATKKGKIVFPFGSPEKPERPRLTFKKISTGDWRVIKVEDADYPQE